MDKITYRILNREQLEKECPGLTLLRKTKTKYNVLAKLRTIQKISALRIKGKYNEKTNQDKRI